jgi:hypothetical protein
MADPTDYNPEEDRCHRGAAREPMTSSAATSPLPNPLSREQAF